MSHASQPVPLLPPGTHQQVMMGGGGAPSGGAAALAQQAQQAQQAPYIPDERLVRMSLKVFNCTPDQLLPLVRGELQRLLDASPAMLEGYIRPGCTHLTLNLRLPRHQAAALQLNGRMLGRLLAPTGSLAPLLACQDMVLQVDSQLAIVHSGHLVGSVVNLQQPGPASCMAPRLTSLHPACVLAGLPGASPPSYPATSTAVGLLGKEEARLKVTLVGANISGVEDLVLCRQQGRHLAVEFLDSPQLADGQLTAGQSEGQQQEGCEARAAAETAAAATAAAAAATATATATAATVAAAALPPLTSVRLLRYASTARSVAEGTAVGFTSLAAADPSAAAAIAMQAGTAVEAAAAARSSCAGDDAPAAGGSVLCGAGMLCSAGSTQQQQQQQQLAAAATLPTPEQQQEVSIAERQKLLSPACDSVGCPQHAVGPIAAVPAAAAGDEAAAEAGAAAGGEEERVVIRPLGLLPGCVEIEVQRGNVLSRSRPLLVLPCAAAVAEVQQLTKPGGSAGISSVPCFLRDIGLVVQYLYRRQLAASGHYVPRYTPAVCRRIALLAHQLTCAATSRGWPALAALLQPAMEAASPANDDSCGCEAEAGDGVPPGEAAAAPPPLQHAQLSGSTSAGAVLLQQPGHKRQQQHQQHQGQQQRHQGQQQRHQLHVHAEQSIAALCPCRSGGAGPASASCLLAASAVVGNLGLSAAAAAGVPAAVSRLHSPVSDHETDS